jgi:hypothetical protein
LLASQVNATNKHNPFASIGVDSNKNRSMLYQTLLFTGALGFLALVTLGTFHGTKGLGRHGRHGHHHGGLGKFGRAKMLLAVSPIDLFAFSLGMGATGLLLPHNLSSTTILVLAILVGLIFDLAFLKPAFNFALKFASTPSDGLEGTIAKFATSVSNFDSSGRGLVSIIIDAEEKQLLATLEESDRSTPVRKGEQLLVTAVDAKRNSCSVSRM